MLDFGDQSNDEALVNMESELAGIFGDKDYIYNVNYDMIINGQIDSQKVNAALEISRKYLDQQSVFSWNYAKGLNGETREQFEALSETRTTLWVLQTNAESINNYPEVFQSGETEIVVREENFNYYGDSARFSTENIWRDKTKDVFSIYVDGVEIEDYYMTGSNKSIHYDERFALTKDFVKGDDCTWKVERTVFYQMVA